MYTKEFMKYLKTVKNYTQVIFTQCAIFLLSFSFICAKLAVKKKIKLLLILLLNSISSSLLTSVNQVV